MKKYSTILEVIGGLVQTFLRCARHFESREGPGCEIVKATEFGTCLTAVKQEKFAKYFKVKVVIFTVLNLIYYQ